MLEYIFAAIIISKWFSILREPDQLFSWYNRMLIGWDCDYLEFDFTNDGNIIEKTITLLFTFASNLKPFIYKVLTCALCHSGYLAIYFIFTYNQHFIILPATMVVYYLLSKIKVQ
jgi:hypothetical protein